LLARGQICPKKKKTAPRIIPGPFLGPGEKMVFGPLFHSVGADCVSAKFPQKPLGARQTGGFKPVSNPRLCWGKRRSGGGPARPPQPGVVGGWGV